MKAEIVNSLTDNFEANSHNEDGVEFWLARDFQRLLGYSKWENFVNVVNKAKIACEVSGQNCQEHFPDVRKLIVVNNGGEREIDDMALTRYACYLIAQNGDPNKEEIAFAQAYTETEKELSSVIYRQTGNERGFALIRSKGDKAFFGGKDTREMKIIWGIGDKPIADFMPTILLKAKDFATEITIHNARENKMRTENQISNEPVANNTSVRNTLISRGITPERLPPSEDIKKVNRKIETTKKNDIKIILKNKK